VTRPEQTGSPPLRGRRRLLYLLVFSIQAQAFWFTVGGGISGAWAGVQLGHVIEDAHAYNAQQEQQAEQAPETPTVQSALLPPAIALPAAPAEAAVLYTLTPTPRPTPRPTQTPRPIPPGPQPDRFPAVSPFVFHS